MPANVQAKNPRIDLSRYELSLDGRRVKLERQPMELLIFFVQRKGELVTREDIVHLLWGKDVFVDVDGSINAAVRKIRLALKDDSTKPHCLETVVGKGYRFIAQIELVGGPALPSPALGEGTTSSGSLPNARTRTDDANGFGRWMSAGAASAIIAGLIVGWWLPKRLSAPSALRQAPIRAIAVLPFENLSGDLGQDYFAEGITDELTTELAQVPSLQVISRTSAAQYRGAHKPTPQIGRELNIDAVVEGSVVRSRNHVRITAQPMTKDAPRILSTLLLLLLFNIHKPNPPDSCFLVLRVNSSPTWPLFSSSRNIFYRGHRFLF